MSRERRVFGRIEHGTRWVASRDDSSSIISRTLERSAQGQALPSTPPSACYPKTDDKDVNGCARKAPRDYRADHVPGGELLSNDGRHLDLYRGCKVVLSVREWRPRAAGGSFYSAKTTAKNNSPYLAIGFHWSFPALANQKRGKVYLR